MEVEGGRGGMERGREGGERERVPIVYSYFTQFII